MERFGLFEILKNMLPFLGDNSENGENSSSADLRDDSATHGQSTGESAQPKRADGSDTNAPDPEPISASREAILQFMSSHESRSKRIKK